MISICKQFFQALFENVISKSACFSYSDFMQMQDVLSFPRSLRHPADYTNICHRLLNRRATLVLCIF